MILVSQGVQSRGIEWNGETLCGDSGAINDARVFEGSRGQGTAKDPNTVETLRVLPGMGTHNTLSCFDMAHWLVKDG